MLRSWILGAFAILLTGSAAGAQTPPAMTILNRVSGAHRSLQTFRATGTLTRAAGEKTLTASVTLALERPNRYLLDVVGEKLSTFVVSDGANVVTCRPENRVYTKAKAPQRLMGGNLLAKTDVPTPAARLITLLAEGRLYDTTDPIAKGLAAAEVRQGSVDGKAAYVLSFRFGESFPAKLKVSAADYLVRSLEVTREGKPYVTETYTEIETGKPLDAKLFVKEPPLAAHIVSALPPLAALETRTTPTAPDFTLQTVDGGSVTLSQLRGKVVLLNFFFVGCPYCEKEFPHLVEWYELYKDRGFTIVAVDKGDEADAIKAYAKEQRLTFTLAMNETTADVVGMYNVEGYPTSVVIDKEGHVVDTVVGYDLEKLQAALRKAGLK